MAQKDKELLLKDLCARLPYGVIADTPKGKGHVCDINLTIFGTEIGVNINPTVRDTFSINDVKPYLLPMSSMTEKQKNECFKGTPLEIDKYGSIAVKDDLYGGSLYTDLDIYLEVIVWLLKNHFDYRGLIPKGLALDATGLNIY